MPSPNAASLGTYGRLPVSYYTGTTQINIPIHTIKTGQLALPISLSYLSIGVMPDKHPGWVGLNWNLNVGGVIVRTVRDLPDEHFNHHYWENSQTKTIDSAGYYYNYSVCNTSQWETYTYAKSLASDKFKDYIDTEPDEFVFNFPGGSGSFYLGEDGQWKVKSTDNIKVTFDNTFLTLPDIYYYGNSSYTRNDKCFSGFTLTTDDGTQFVFGGTINAVEYSIHYWPQAYEDYVGNSWHLSKIITPEGRVIQFDYEKDGVIMEVHRSTNYTYRKEWRQGYFFCEDPFVRTWINIFHFSKILISPSYLKKVTTPLEELTFHRSNSTELRYTAQQYGINPSTNYDPSVAISKFGIWSIDPTVSSPISGSALMNKIQWKKLDKITIASKTGMQNPSYYFEFKYNNTASERLMLLSLEKKVDNSPSQQHQFHYYNHGSVQLPAYASTQVDHWGYYNAKVGNTVLEDSGTSSVPESFYQNYRNERVHSTNIDVLQEGSLKKVVYPTGGFTELIYEQHAYSREVDSTRNTIISNSSNKTTGGLRIKKIIDRTDSVANNPIVREIFYVRNFRSGDTLSSGVLNGQFKYWFESFDLIGTKYLLRKVFSSNNILPFSGNSEGIHLGYSEVAEKRSDGSYTVYKFSNFDNGYKDELITLLTDVPSRTFTPYDPYNDKSMERGHLLATEVFNSAGDSVSKEVNTYAALGNQFVRSINTGNLPSCDGVYGYATCFPYRNYIYKFEITEKKQYVYQNGQNPIVIKTNFYYDNANHNYPTRATTTDSKGALLKTENKYPHDFAGTAVYDTMINRNIIRPWVQQKLYKDAVLLTTQKTDYALWHSNLFVKPFAAKIAKFSNPLQTEISFDAYDNKGNNIQHTKRNTGLMSFIWDYQQSFVIAEVKNADTPSIAYTSFEAEGKGNWNYSGNPFQDNTAPTGRKVYKLSNGNIAKNSLSNSSTYFVSYWSKNGVQSVNGATGLSGHVVGSWQYWIHKVTNPPGGIITVSGNGTIDELRLYPEQAQMTTYTYEPLVGMTAQCDVAGQVTYYEYDDLQRLMVIRDQDKKILKKICYNYAGQAENCTIYYNVQKSGVFTPTCSPPYVGQQVTYTVPADTYSSIVSQGKADTLAIMDVNANGQVFADANGTCMPPFSGINVTTMPWTITVTATDGSFNNSYTLYPSSTATILANLLPGTYNLTMTPAYTAGSVQLTLNSNTYNGTSFSLTGITINTATTFTLQSPCTISMASGYSSPTRGISNNETTVTFYITFSPTSSSMLQNSTYFVATISTGCRPQADRVLPDFSTGGRTWRVTVQQNGMVLFKLMSGSTVFINNTITTPSLNYNLNN